MKIGLSYIWGFANLFGMLLMLASYLASFDGLRIPAQYTALYMFCLCFVNGIYFLGHALLIVRDAYHL